ncbi:MAG: hypothetical protein CMG69_05395 [Candidatus Marinimicrobia bacterium]|nr:hypothetical protein [Candidatus Neomarinimicrobiota bacterium]|tara:strand:- start:2867 stop:3046 length:180 start_codon:yes stop_codon:yes gene_type:complete
MISKVFVAIFGSIFIILGLILLVTPGPGLVFLAFSLGIWSTKFPFIKRYLKMIKEKIKE